MKIEWNKVTWYSKIIALVLFVGLPFAGFYLGIHYGRATMEAGGTAVGPQGSSTTSSPNANTYYGNVAEWQTDSRPDAGFAITHPIDFTADDDYAITPVTDWRLGANGTAGIKRVTITIPSTFEPQTNFGNAMLTVGDSKDQGAVANCMTVDLSGVPIGTVSTTTINGTVFSVYKSSDVGAGQLYETTSYRTVHAGACYAVEYTIHSSQIANYPASYNLQPFDEGKLTDVLGRIVGTFTFL